MCGGTEERENRVVVLNGNKSQKLIGQILLRACTRSSLCAIARLTCFIQRKQKNKNEKCCGKTKDMAGVAHFFFKKGP